MRRIRSFGRPSATGARAKSPSVLRLPDQVLLASDEKIETICETFAEIIDAKSPYTNRHSVGVAQAAEAIGSRLKFAPQDMITLHRAALLHDIGKLSVPNSILDRPGKLTPHDWETVRLHPYHTQRILEKVVGFKHLAFIASTHHEKLDGSGYYRNLRASQLPLTARALALADMYDALSNNRSYRDALPREKVLETIAHDVPHAVDPDCFAAPEVRGFLQSSASAGGLAPPDTVSPLVH